MSRGRRLPVIVIFLAEACGDRTHQGQRKLPLTGFEARARHQTNLTSVTSLFYPYLLKKSIKTFCPLLYRSFTDARQ